MRYLLISNDSLYSHNLVCTLNENGSITDILKDAFIPTPLVSLFIRDYNIDAIILDLSTFSRTQGKAIIKLWLSYFYTPPTVFVIHKRDHYLDGVHFLNCGVDGCQDRNEDTRIISARLSAIIRRKQGYFSERFSHHPLILDCVNHLLFINNINTNLTKMEARVLEVLMRNKGKIVSRNDIILKLYPELPSDGRFSSLDVILNRLRKKLQAHMPKGLDAIHTYRGFGVSFEIRKRISK
ncbi:TPA: winged helix-turn-helix domain-containing protein [Klebsiella quasipneumoniae subsp. quasipneumoniae]|nr:winged helix-turn-helix domain-containing protein [Klebsiella quasipneumoniae subsp. quasipneumoniae]